MQGSENWGFVWGAMGDNAGRSVRQFFETAGCSDFKVYIDGHENGYKCHDQGVPKELEGYPIISNTRNPYSKAISFFLDNSLAASHFALFIS